MTLSQLQKRIILVASGALVILVGWFAITGYIAKHHLAQAQTSLSELHVSDVLAHPQDVHSTLETARNDVAQASRWFTLQFGQPHRTCPFWVEA